MISETDMLLRLVVAAALGALIGWERERHNQPAGLRTHIALAIGASLVMVLSINMAVQYKDAGADGDPARLAAQVVSGIGFLGAGAILRYGETVKGLTTATSLWTVAMIGLAVGTGAYIAASGAALLLLAVLAGLNVVEKRYIIARMSRTIALAVKNREGVLDEICQDLKAAGLSVASLGVSQDAGSDLVTFEAVVKHDQDLPVSAIYAALNAIPGVASFSVSKGTSS